MTAIIIAITILLMCQMFANDDSLDGTDSESASSEEEEEEKEEDVPLDPGEIEHTLSAAITLRNNILLSVGTALRNMRLTSKANEYKALSSIFEGFQAFQIDTMDIVGNVQDLLDESPNKQFLGILKRLRSTVSCRFYCEIDISVNALKQGTIDFNMLLDNSGFSFLKDVGLFRKRWLKSLWFSKTSDSVGVNRTDFCDRQARFYFAISKAFTNKILPLTANIYTSFLLNLNYNYMPSDAYEILKHVTGIIKSESQSVDDFFIKIKLRDYSNIYSMCLDILVMIEQNKLIKDSNFYFHISMLQPYMVPKPLGTFFYDDNPQMSDLLSFADVVEELRYIDVHHHPSDVIEAFHTVLDELVIRSNHLKFINISLLYYSYEDKEDVLLAILQRLVFVLEKSSRLVQLSKSLMIHFKLSEYTKDNRVYIPSARHEIILLLDSFRSLQEEGVTSMIQEVLRVISATNIPWGKILENFQVPVSINPRPLFMEILKELIKYDNIFQFGQICQLKNFIDAFVLMKDDVDFVKTYDNRTQNVIYRTKISTCLSQCLSTSTNKKKMPFGDGIGTRRPVPLYYIDNTYAVQTQRLRKQGIYWPEDTVLKVKKVSGEALVAVLDPQTPSSIKSFVLKYLSNPSSYDKLKRFDYKAYKKRSVLLLNLLNHLKKKETDKKTIDNIEQAKKHIKSDEIGDQSPPLKTGLLRIKYKAPKENITTVFSQIKQDNMCLRDKQILLNILKHFENISNSEPSYSCLGCFTDTFDHFLSAKKTQNFANVRKAYEPNISVATVGNNETCTQKTIHIWKISGVPVNILGVLQAIPKFLLPQSDRVVYERVHQTFQNDSISFSYFLRKLNLENYKTRSELLKDIFHEFYLTPNLDTNLVHDLKTIEPYIRSDRAGDEPVDIIDDVTQPGEDFTSIAIDLENLFNVPLENDDLKTSKDIQNVIDYLENSPDDLANFFHHFTFERCVESNQFLVKLLEHLASLPKIPSFVRSSAQTLTTIKIKGVTDMPFVIYSDYTKDEL